MGSETNYFGMEDVEAAATTMKTLGDAALLRNRMVALLEEAAQETDDSRRRRLMTFVVAGGGFSGVEVAAELNDFVRGVARNYRGIDPREIRVVLVHSQNRILPELSEKLALFAQNILMKRGVELRLDTRLEAATGEEAILANGEMIPTRTLVSTVPSSPHPIIDGLDLPKGKNGRLVANSFLEVQGAENIWALGDCAQVPTKDGGVAPPTAQHALRQARTAADNIVAAIRGGKRSEFAFGGLGQMGALGHHSAVAQIMGVNISGIG
jgi:NADH dehydrogenase